MREAGVWPASNAPRQLLCSFISIKLYHLTRFILELLTSWHVVLQHDVQHECPPHLQQAYRPDVCEVAQTDVDGILPKKMVKFALFLDAALARLLFQAHSRESNQVTHLAQYARMHIHILQLSL